jgi:superfamily II DNA/RNA helicase
MHELNAMRELSGHDAFDAIVRLLAGEADDPWCTDAVPFERLRIALSGVDKNLSPLDLAVLLRQALRYEYARRGHEANPSILLKHARITPFCGWEQVGISAVKEAGGWRVVVHAWRPTWLRLPPSLGVDDEASGEAVRRQFGADGCEGDPFLRAIGRSTYRSSGQRAAVRAALSTPAAGTLVVALPTGEGKSMIFQLVHAIGFVGEDARVRPGVTLVIVPTVALGVNHEEEAVSVCALSRPLAYQGGADVSNATIGERISEGVQGLCFASPEAACSGLRSSLRQAAEAGELRAIVVDEAHLVDQWGTGFRSEFQELSGLRRELIALAPEGRQPRTLLLSATLTDSSLDTLRTLFGAEGAFESCAAVRLRPEPDYWAAISPEHERTARVLEALHHVPRPAVLYVTQVDHAEAWRDRLREAGFGRVRMLHGKTRREDREKIVSQWRDGALDVVIGTSAFGLGIDFAHARSVLHACIPETLDRFYQEVGRGGRDGRAALSLIVAAQSDFAIAEKINRQQVISVERGLERWSGMFGGKHALGGNRIAVRVDGSPGTSEDDIDMTGMRNADWNLRTLSLMARAGLVRLHGAPQPPLQLPGDWLALDLLDDGHLTRPTWEARVVPVRRASRDAGETNLELMRQFLRADRCPAEILEQLYGRDKVARVCSRCALCREDPSKRQPAISLGEPRAPWALSLPPLLARFLDADRRLLIAYRTEHAGAAESRRLGDTVERLQRLGLAKVILIGTPPFNMQRVLLCAEKTSMFVSRLPSLAHSRMPAGPEMVMVGPKQTLSQTSLDAKPGKARFFLVPEEQAAPNGRRLVDIFRGRVLTLDEFNERVAQ